MKKRKIKQWLLACCMVFFAVCSVNAGTYDYPLTDPIEATIIGTPAQVRAELPDNIRVKRYETIDVFPDRAIPDLFFYNEELRYSVAYHKEKAPLIFMIAGTGAGYDSEKMKMMQKAFFQAGFHVVALSSPTHPNFIVSASATGMPGDIQSDSEDLYRVMEMLWAKVRKKELVSEFYLTGYSLGGSQAAFVAKIDEERKIFNFKKVLMINPALNLYDSATKIDAMLEDNVPGGLDNLDAFFDKMMGNVSRAYRRGDFLDLSYGFFYTAYDQILPSPEEGKAVIGFAFRISAANILFVSDVMTNAGLIVPKNANLSVTDSLTDYSKIAFRQQGFKGYVEHLLFPQFKKANPGVTLQNLIDKSSLRSIEGYLKQQKKIGMVTNADDFILAPGDINYFKQVFDTRAKIYPKGGHCGNMAYKDNVAYMIDYFTSE